MEIKTGGSVDEFDSMRHWRRPGARALSLGVLSLVAMMLVGCPSNTDNGSSPPAAPPSNNWDSMVWDQGNWG